VVFLQVLSITSSVALVVRENMTRKQYEHQAGHSFDGVVHVTS
jgi:hypothetical protein